MADIRSPYWNERDGICEKHMSPQLPCTLCFKEQDPDMEVHFTELDYDVCHAEQIPLTDLLPEGCEWLMKHVV